MNYEEFFERATGTRPYSYQRRLAAEGLPPVIQAPTGTGKTAAVILAWLWQRMHGPDQHATPRRLIFALPQRTLVEQTAGNAAVWLSCLKLTDDIPLHVVMGGTASTQSTWRLQMDRPTIVIGTVDSLVSKALNRGYGISRDIYPIDFALVTNGAHWVIDEIQLCRESTTTLRQLAAFTAPGGAWPTAEPFGLTCMSATVSELLLDTVDNPAPDEASVVRIGPEDRTGALAPRLNGRRTIRRLHCERGDYRAIAAAARERHRPGALTLVVVNRPETARNVFAALGDVPAACTLVHGQFRGIEREALTRRITEHPGEANHIVVATQVVEAGVDINASVLITEAAPWPSIVQRAGRCNRTGVLAEAELWWLRPKEHRPYEESDIDATVAELTALEGRSLTGEDLLSRSVALVEAPVAVIRRPDLLALFDTTQDLTGGDVDISPYVRDSDDLNVELSWAQWRPADDRGRPPADAKAPEPRLRCRAPVSEVRRLSKTKDIWRFDQTRGRWEAVTGQAPARPGEVLVMSASDGCYDADTGFDPAATGSVAGAPELGERPDPAAGVEAAYGQDDASVLSLEWVGLEQHSADVRDAALALMDKIRPALTPVAREAVAVAAHAHDAGKSHATWQDALCQLASPEDRERINAGRPWAKSDRRGRLRFAGGVTFRHELASLLLLDGPLQGLLHGAADPDLVRYLVLAHHGRLRVQVRAPENGDERVLLGLKDGAVVATSALLGQPAGEVTIDIGQFELGGERSWTRTALRLRDRYGPFLLTYLETLVRIADWRASGPALEAPREPKDAR